MHEGFTAQLQGFTNLCQALAGACETHELPLNTIAKRIVGALPETHSAPDFFLLRSTLLEFIAGTAAITRADAESSLTALTTLIHSRPPTGDLGAAVTRCLAVIGAAAIPAPATRPASRAERAMAVIAERCTEPAFTIHDLAKTLHVSPAYVSKLLRAWYGYGFRAARTAARMRAARRLLARSLKAIKEIDAEVGYTSTSQFDRDFKRVCGVRPGEYRCRRNRVRSLH